MGASYNLIIVAFVLEESVLEARLVLQPIGAYFPYLTQSVLMNPATIVTQSQMLVLHFSEIGSLTKGGHDWESI